LRSAPMAGQWLPWLREIAIRQQDNGWSHQHQPSSRSSSPAQPWTWAEACARKVLAYGALKPHPSSCTPKDSGYFTRKFRLDVCIYRGISAQVVRVALGANQATTRACLPWTQMCSICRRGHCAQCTLWPTFNVITVRRLRPKQASLDGVGRGAASPCSEDAANHKICTSDSLGNCTGIGTSATSGANRVAPGSPSAAARLQPGARAEHQVPCTCPYCRTSRRKLHVLADGPQRPPREHVHRTCTQETPGWCREEQ